MKQSELAEAYAQFFSDHPDELKKGSKEEKIVRGFGVPRSGEFRRIEALPRRRWEEAPDLDELIALLHRELWAGAGGEKCADDCRCPRFLKPLQAAALRDIYDQAGAFLPIGVGKGKTLISILMFTLLDAKRPLLLVPPDLRAQTEHKKLPELRRHWRVHPGILVVGHNEISLTPNKDFLDEYDPDVMGIDESQAFADQDSGRTKRLRWYLDRRRREGRPVVFVPMSGTMARKSICDFAPLLEWALGRENCPLPCWSTHYRETQMWADALDVRVPPGKRMPPGALGRLCEEGEKPLQGFHRRLVETPGVVASQGEDNVDASLIIRVHSAPFTIPKSVADALQRLRDDWELPDGSPIMEAMDLWRHARELAQGFFYRWDPPPTLDWVRARRAWNTYVRDVLRHNRRKLATEKQVKLECEAMAEPPIEWIEWRALVDTYTPNSVPVWISDFIKEPVQRWIEAEKAGIIWIEADAVGEMLSRELGVRYYGAGERDSLDILNASGAILASIHSHHKGKDLQWQFSKALYILPAAGGHLWQQSLGRTHREGQPADQVVDDVWLATPELKKTWEDAKAEAVWAETSMGDRQKLCFATILEV
jgi:hypothetical protein